MEKTGITYTNYICSDHGEIAFLALSRKEQEQIGNSMRRNPLEQFGRVVERPPG